MRPPRKVLVWLDIGGQSCSSMESSRSRPLHSRPLSSECSYTLLALFKYAALFELFLDLLRLYRNAQGMRILPME